MGELEVEDHVQPAVAAIRCGQFGIVAEQLADRCALGIPVQQPAQLRQRRVHLRLVDIVYVVLAVEAAQPELRRVVRVAGMLVPRIEYVQAKAIDAAIEPEARGVHQRPAHFRVVPVQIRLLAQEHVVVVLARRRIPFPGFPAEDRLPVVRGTAAGPPVAPDVPIAVRTRAETIGRRRTTDAGPTCGCRPGRAGRGCRAGVPRRSSGRNRPGCRSADRWRCSRRRRTRSPGRGRGSTARSRWRRRPGCRARRSGSRGGRSARAGRPARRRSRRRTSAGRRGRSRRPATIPIQD